MEKKKLFEIIGISCAGVGFLLTFIFTFISCSSSAKKVATKGDYDGSLLFIVVVVGAILAIGGGVLAFLSKEQGAKFGIMALITFGLVAVTMLFAVLPHATICAYNCSMKDKAESRASSLTNALDQYSDYFDY